MCQFDIISILQRAKSNTLRPGAATDCSKTNNYLDLWKYHSMQILGKR